LQLEVGLRVLAPLLARDELAACLRDELAACLRIAAT
jgi:hypothetical protein